MLKNALTTACAAVLALGLFSVAAPADAQSRGVPGSVGSATEDQATPPSQTRDPRSRRSRSSNNRAPQMSPQQAIEKAQEVATAAGVPCQVTEAKLLGQDAERVSYLEATCATGPGYILSDAQPPRALDCVLVTSQAEAARARDPEADVGQQCTYPQNTDVLRVLTVYAQEAGVPCTPDQGAAIGTIANGVAYEVGCAGVQGYRIENVGGSWTLMECLQVLSQGGACRFTTPEESAASVKTMLAGSDAAGCDVTQARFMGENTNGRFYEAKCAAGNGVIARLQDTAVQQIYPCETAQRIGGGCTLTQVAAAPASSEQN